VSGELDVRGDTLEHGEVRERLGDTLPIASIVDTDFRSREIVLVVRVLDVNERSCPLWRTSLSRRRSRSRVERICGG
jgi:hypothetical protein